MGNIKLNNGEVISDRRVNGSRIKLDIADWIKISITILTTFAIIVFGAGKLLTIVNNHTEILAGQANEIKNNSKHIATTETDIANIKESVNYIRGKIDTFIFKITGRNEK